MTREQLMRRETALSHAIQSAIAFQIQAGCEAATPKHLRVGVDTSKADHGALVKLLVEKGVFTEEEYFVEMIAGLERELEFQTKQAQKYGAPSNVTFG